MKSYQVGERVEVRDAEYEGWKTGTIKEIIDGRPKVQPDGWDKVYFWNIIQPSVGVYFCIFCIFALFVILSYSAHEELF